MNESGNLSSSDPQASSASVPLATLSSPTIPPSPVSEAPDQQLPENPSENHPEQSSHPPKISPTLILVLGIVLIVLICAAIYFFTTDRLFHSLELSVSTPTPSQLEEVISFPLASVSAENHLVSQWLDFYPLNDLNISYSASGTLQINGLKDKVVEAKIITEIKNTIEEMTQQIQTQAPSPSTNPQCNAFVKSSFSDTLSGFAHCSVFDTSVMDHVALSKTFNFRLDTGEKINFADLFIADTDVRQLINRTSSRTKNATTDDVTAEAINAFERQNNSEQGVNFYFDPTGISISLQDFDLFIDFSINNLDQVAIYKRFLSHDSLYETDNKLFSLVLFPSYEPWHKENNIYWHGTGEIPTTYIKDGEPNRDYEVPPVILEMTNVKINDVKTRIEAVAQKTASNLIYFCHKPNVYIYGQAGCDSLNKNIHGVNEVTFLDSGCVLTSNTWTKEKINDWQNGAYYNHYDDSGNRSTTYDHYYEQMPEPIEQLTDNDSIYFLDDGTLVPNFQEICSDPTQFPEN